MKTALTIAGTDPSGGAGIQADIKTMTANGVFATCAVTALVAQNTTGVKDIVECTPEFLAEELDCVFTDIFPDAVKTGMVSSIPLIETIAAKLKEYGAKNLVVDPVMVATSGDRLISEDAVSALKELLLPLATTVGTFAGAALASITLAYSLSECLAVGSGFAYYSLSSIFITQYKGAELGTVALLANIMRELATLLFTPLMVRWISPLAAISCGGASTMDSPLPVITRFAGRQWVFVSIVHAMILDFSVPFWVTFFCTL